MRAPTAAESGGRNAYGVDRGGGRGAGSDFTQLTFLYKAPTNPLDSGDRGTSISFNGIYLRPRSDTRIDGTVVRRIGAAGTCRGASGIAAPAKPLKNLRTGTQIETLNLF